MDIQATITETDQTFNELISLLSSFEPKQFNTIPFEGSWSAGQLAQHVILSAGGFVLLLNGPMKDSERDPEENIPNLRAMFLDFSTRMQSPQEIVPEEKEYDQEQLTTTLNGIQASFLDAIEKADITKTCTAFEIPKSGYMTVAEAIVFNIVHTQRHIHQLKGIKVRL